MTSISTPRFALVTGTSSGIGAVLTEQLLARGWHVLGVSRRQAAIAHPEYEHRQVDLADTSALPASLEESTMRLVGERPWRRVALVNNAAHAGPLGPLERVSADDLARAHAVNTVAPMWLMGLFVRVTPGGAALRIVNVSSGAARHATLGLGPYCSSKAALRMAGSVLAGELESPLRNTPAPHDAAILSYEPGVVETPMQQAARGTAPGDFPWVGLFLGFKEQGIVVPPERPAAEIVEFLEGDASTMFTERRLGA